MLPGLIDGHPGDDVVLGACGFRRTVREVRDFSNASKQDEEDRAVR